ncbi:MAG: hypothetical protein ACLFWM_11580 [Actinomycetota bacterium]
MTQDYRPTGPLMRFALILGAVLTFLSGVQLFGLTDSTADTFAWTIGAGATATVIGAFYWTACVLAYLSWRRQPWARARVGVPGVTLFLWVTLFATLVHLENLHLSSGSASGQFAAWAWLVIYVVDPVLVSAALVRQRRMAGADPPRVHRLPTLYRATLDVVGGGFALVGLTMVVSPAAAMDLSAFPLTPLTSRTIGAWVLAMGAVFVTMAWENDRDRIRPAAVASMVAPALLLIGMLRYLDQFSWDGRGWAYLVMIGLILAMGIGGLVGRSEDTPATA